MFQDFQLFPHMNVMNNILYAPKLQKCQSKDNKNMEENLRSKSIEILSVLGILAKADEYPHNLSGGQKQRAALARSLMMNPDVLLCDEPTSGLDIAGIDDVITLLKGVQKNFATTMVIASHNVNFLNRVSDRIIILKGGKIAENGNRL
jgi:polar amino acid transport system ATP-binding protein